MDSLTPNTNAMELKASRDRISACTPLSESDTSGALEQTCNTCESKRFEQDLQFRSLVEHFPDMIVRYNQDLRRTYVNALFASMVGCNSDDLLGKRPSEYPGGSCPRTYEQYLSTVFSSGKSLSFEMAWVTYAKKNVYSLVRFTPEFDLQGNVDSVLAILHDMTELNIPRQQLFDLTYYDSLTGLPNRTLLSEHFHQSVGYSSRNGRKVCIMLLDLDRFKAINDTMGHDAGDNLLYEIANRLKSQVRSYDTVARLGGDKFVILVSDMCNVDDVSSFAEKILQEISQPFVLQGCEVVITGSIGIALCPDDGDDDKELLKYAESAMYLAKRSGRQSFRFYSKELTRKTNLNLQIETELRHALRRNEMEVYFQPKVCFESCKVHGSEALARWKSATLGVIPPSCFIPIAEETGQIIEIGNWVLRKACGVARELNTRNLPVHKIAVNLSVRQFLAGDLVASVRSILEETACQPEWIEFEITESLLLEDSKEVADILASFRSVGITLAVDDFGTGYSALSYLADFSIDTLKIDKSFVQSITTDQRRAELVKAILSIAHCLGLDVVAEGVETYEQVTFLKENNCQYAQGWYFSKPLSEAMLVKLLTGKRNRRNIGSS